MFAAQSVDLALVHALSAYLVDGEGVEVVRVEI